MRKYFIKKIKGPTVGKAVRERKDLYEIDRSRRSVIEYQTKRFNEVWGRALHESPFYRRWADNHSLPQEITDIREVASFPVLRKRDLTEATEALLKTEPESFYLSGGTTGEPAKFPKNKREGVSRYANNVLTHAWLGLSPGDRYIHLWGHAHLFGNGRRAAMRKALRRSKDWLVGGYRLNVYNQASADIGNWIESIERIRPKYIVGYSSALVNLASEIENTRGSLYIDNLEWIICTAETVTQADIAKLEKVFRVPIAIEYGAIETGVIAHTRPLLGERLQLLWGSLAANANDNGSLRLSTLEQRAFPLINYEIGDRVAEADNLEHVLSFRSVLGRTGEQVSLTMRDGSIGQISMVGIVGAIKNIPGVRTVQAAQVENGAVEIYVTGGRVPNAEQMSYRLVQELSKTGVYISLKAVSFKHLQEPIKSTAGKISRIVPRIKT